MLPQGVLGYVIMDATGAVVHTGFEVCRLLCAFALSGSCYRCIKGCCGVQPEVGEKYAILIHPLAKLADNMTRDLDPRVRRPAS